MLKKTSGLKNTLGIASLTLLAAGCATSGSYQGIETEKAYDKALDAARMTAVINNDDYYEMHKDGRIVVLSDKGDLKLFLDTGDIPFRLTRIGGGPKGETVVYGIAAPEKNKKDGFGSVEMFEGRRAGAEKDFYGEVLATDGKWYVFGDWASLDAYRKTGTASGMTAAGASAAGEAVMVASNGADKLTERFRSVHGTGVLAAAPTPAPVAKPVPAAKTEPAAKPAAPAAPAAPAKPKKKKKAAAPAAAPAPAPAPATK